MGPLRLALAAPVVVLCGLAAQGQTPALRIVSPADGAYLTGAVRLAAAIDPPAAERDVTRVAFFADGHQVCTIVRPPFECEWHAGELITEHQVRVVATLRDGKQIVQTVRSRGITVSEAVDVDVVQVTAVVIDGDGRFVRGLTRDDFRIFEDDQRQPITNFAAENIPLELVAAIDVSGSMRDVIGTVKDAAKRFLAAVAPTDQVTVLAFNENIFTPARRATDPALRARAVDRIAAWGGTALYDVIIRAVEILGRQSGRRAIVLFTDGEDQSSHAPLEAAIRATEGSDATIYAVGLGRAVNSPVLQKLMKQIASVSGGRAFFSHQVAQLDAIFADILDDLRNQYVLSYPAPDSQRNGQWHTIRVEVAGGRHTVRARQGYRLTRE